MYAGAPMMSALAVAVLGCTSTAGLPEPTRAPALRATATLSPPSGRAIRYYVDDKGMIWDDRGKKHDAAPTLR